MATNLFRRNATYYVRVAVPRRIQDLRLSLSGHRGSREVLRSLGTKDLASARTRQAAELARIHQDFEREEADLRRQGAARLTVPTEQDLQVATFQFRANELALDEKERSLRPSRSEIERKAEVVRGALAQAHWTPLQQLADSGYLEVQVAAEVAESAADRRRSLAQDLRESLGDNEFHLVDWAIQDVALRNRWRINKGDPNYRALGRHLIRAWLGVIEAADARDKGIYHDDGQVVARISRGRETLVGSARTKEHGLRHYFQRYLDERHPNLRSNARKDRWATIRQFVEIAGDKAVAEYRKVDLRTYKEVLEQMPARVEKLYPKVPLLEVLRRNRKDRHPTLRAASIRNKLSTIAAFGAWLAENVDGLDASNFKVTLPRRADSARMEPFSSDQIAKILNARAFTGCKSEKNQLEPGSFRIRDWRFWLPLMLAFTGARLNEVVQLRVGDIREVDGVWVFSFTDEGDGQSLKTAASRRDLPIHPQLLALGILNFVQAAKDAGHDDLFHDVPLDRDGRHSTNAGKWFRKFLARIGVKGTELGGAHRWRHTLADALRRAGTDDFDIGRILGHDVNVARMTGHYGRAVDLSVKQRHVLISKAAYPSVDFELLKSR